MLPRFVCPTATKKNNEIHSDPRFLEGRQMGSHFLKSTTMQKLRFFFFLLRRGTVPVLYENILFSPWQEFKSCERVVSLPVCTLDPQFRPSFLFVIPFLLVGKLEHQDPPNITLRIGFFFFFLFFFSHEGFLVYFFQNLLVLLFSFGNVPSTSYRSNSEF